MVSSTCNSDPSALRKLDISQRAASRGEEIAVAPQRVLNISMKIVQKRILDDLNKCALTEIVFRFETISE